MQPTLRTLNEWPISGIVQVIRNKSGIDRYAASVAALRLSAAYRRGDVATSRATYPITPLFSSHVAEFGLSQPFSADQSLSLLHRTAYNSVILGVYEWPELIAMTQKQRMLEGELYTADDPELVADAACAAAWLDRDNRASTATAAERPALLVEGLGHAGRGATIRPTFHCDYGYNIHLGEGVFLNFGCTVLDVVPVRIGAGTRIGPGVQILTADYPRDPVQSGRMFKFGRPVTIGRNVWISGGALILPGITVGDDAIVGAGSVVTRDVPYGVTIAGNPARLLK
ncbi:MAG TPA: sugar O-acetyltransferase [Sphingomonas sp.]|nr:sugar O-acetyltransferase [Sphingomonas sp.]